MNRLSRAVPFTWRNLVRRPLRTALTVLGIAVATFLFCFVGSMRDGVARATEAGAAETTLVVYRKNRFCPFASQLPQRYEREIARLDGVRSVVPMKIVVNNCRASLDVVTFRGVPDVTGLRAALGSASVPDADFTAWQSRQDAVLVGSALAERRRIRAGDRFDAAGVRAWVAGVVPSEDPQSSNAAYAHLGFLQETAQRGGTGGIVTQFNVQVSDPARLEPVASAIDELFAHDQFPTTTRPESAFVARAARDVLALVRFAGMVGWASLAAVFALIANSIALAVRDRVRDHAILRTLGWTGPDIAWMVLMEASMLGLAGGALGAVASDVVIRLARLDFTMEGVSIQVKASGAAALAGVALAAGLGALAGALPAWAAARREIVQGFRSA